MSSHRVSVQRWSVMSSKERINRVHRFVTDCRISPVNDHNSMSSDNRLVVKAAVSAKKPSQRRRCKAERSYSMKKNQGFIIDITKDLKVSS